MLKTATGLPVYTKAFGAAEASRLLWRAGFGPRKGDVARLAKLGLHGAVKSLTEPAAEQLTGPPPTDGRFPIAPNDAVGHDHLWWLDKMVRTNRPLIERMALIWHDWFATSNTGVRQQSLMLQQNQLFRDNALGSMSDLLKAVTVDPAMLLWLNGVQNTLRSPNENYGREMMELFTLGASRGYTEDDVREQARALTGWTATQLPGAGATDFRYEPRLHDPGTKTIFGQSGTFTWEDSCRLCLSNPQHPSYFVKKLWSYFVPTPPDKATEAGLEALYSADHQVKPVVEAILQHHALYTGPRLTKPPVVYTAGLLRATGRGIDSSLWWKLDTLAGQRLFYPPNVGGWDDSRWLDTSTFRGRWFVAMLALDPVRINEQSGDSSLPAEPKKLVDHAADFLLTTITPDSRILLNRFAKAALPQAQRFGNAPAIVVNSLRQLIATSPDYHTS